MRSKCSMRSVMIAAVLAIGLFSHSWADDQTLESLGAKIESCKQRAAELKEEKAKIERAAQSPLGGISQVDSGRRRLCELVGQALRPLSSGRIVAEVDFSRAGVPGGATFDTKKRSIGQSIIDEWVSGLPVAAVIHIVSLLGNKRDGYSEFEYYPFRGFIDPSVSL